MQRKHRENSILVISLQKARIVSDTAVKMLVIRSAVIRESTNQMLCSGQSGNFLFSNRNLGLVQQMVAQNVYSGCGLGPVLFSDWPAHFRHPLLHPKGPRNGKNLTCCYWKNGAPPYYPLYTVNCYYESKYFEFC